MLAIGLKNDPPAIIKGKLFVIKQVIQYILSQFRNLPGTLDNLILDLG